MEEKKKINPLIPILIIVVLLLGVLVAKLWADKNKAEHLVNEYKDSYDQLVIEKEKAEEDRRKAEQSAEEERIKAQQQAEAYQTSYNNLVLTMLNSAATTESVGNLIISVWHNAIWNVDDEETDKFTKKDGSFVSDFNDALHNLFYDEDFSKTTYALSLEQSKVKSEMKGMLNPPDGFDNAFRALENLYNSYIKFTDIVLNCSGSLESFSNDFSAADTDILQQYNAAELYVK